MSRRSKHPKDESEVETHHKENKKKYMRVMRNLVCKDSDHIKQMNSRVFIYRII